MKIPRDVSGAALIKGLRAFGYVVARQDGSHIRVTTELGGQHHLTVPNHSPIKAGLLGAILKDVAAHHKTTTEDVIRKLSL